MTDTPARVLVVDDEADMLETCRRILVRRGYVVEVAGSAECAERLLNDRPFELLIADLMMPGRDGLELARRAHGADPRLAVLIITAHATVESALRATREGAFDYIPKPFSMEQLEVATERALQGRRLREEHAAGGRRGAAYDFHEIVGESPAIQRMLDLAGRVADTDANVLITGESGTGKELVARAIHANSRRRQRRFVPLDCAALPESLLESELFGAERGAYTGAETARPGLVEHADGGTLFLDEVGNLPLSMQVKLLRVLQERAVRRLGSTKQVAVDVRVVAANNRPLEDLVRLGGFREDLYYRLNVVAIVVPPLRDRAGDIRLLAQHLAAEIAGRGRTGVRGVSSAALMLLERHDWPGNVRELRNVIERAISLTDSNQVMPADLPPYLADRPTRLRTGGPFRDAKRRAITDFEIGYVRLLLEECGGNISRAAAAAGLKRTALHRLLARYRIDADDFRPSRGPKPGRDTRIG